MKINPIDNSARQSQAIKLLVEGFGRDVSFWRAAFLAPKGRIGHGLLLEDESNEPVGVLLLFECHRLVNGIQRRVLNLSSWYVRPDHRATALDMICSATADKSAIYTNFSPSAQVEKLMKYLGFRYAWQGSHLSVPLLNGISSRVKITFDTGDSALNALQIELSPNAFYALPDRHIKVRARKQNEVMDAVFRIILRRGYRFGRLAYCSNNQLLRQALPSLHWHLLLRHRLVALLLPMLPVYAGVKSTQKMPHGPVAMVRGEIANDQVDMLHSEYWYFVTLDI